MEQHFTNDELNLLSNTILSMQNYLNENHFFYDNVNQAIREQVKALTDLNAKVCGYMKTELPEIQEKTEQRLGYDCILSFEGIGKQIEEVGKHWKYVDDIDISYSGGRFRVDMTGRNRLTF